MNNQIYMLFYDRGYRAQDNAEHLCRWVMKNHPEVKTSYLLNSGSYDWNRLNKEGFNLIDLTDRPLVKKELLACDYACSSIFNEGINLDFSGCTCKRVFLNHGCFLAPINYLRAECNNIDLFIAANKLEYDTMLNPYHKLVKDQVALCGQPRQDALVKAQKQSHKENSILIQFWQRPGAWTADNDKKFLASNFYKKTSAILSNKQLLKYCIDHHIELIFKMHSIQYDWLKYYKKFANEVVKISPLSEPFEPVFIKSKLIITDISSNAYEMAKINKPCIYFEPDPIELFSWRKRKNGDVEFDLEKYSIGPIIEDSVDSLVAEICRLIENNFTLDELYISRRKAQISFLNDENNCLRCFEAIMNLSRSRTKVATEKAKIRKKQNMKDYTSGRGNTFLYF